MGNEGLTTWQMRDKSIVEEVELESLGGENSQDLYAGPYTIISIIASTKTITLQSGTDVELTFDRVAPNDILIITGGLAAGSYTVDLVISDTMIKVNEDILDATSGELKLYYPMGGKRVGFTHPNWTAKNVYNAIIELSNKILASASPGFSFGRSGNIPPNGWLNNETVPSNITGRFVYINNAVIETVFVSNQNINTFDIAVYYHDGDEIGLTFVGKKTVIADRGDSFDVDWAVPYGKQIATRIENGSAKNAVAGLELTGTVTP